MIHVVNIADMFVDDFVLLTMIKKKELAEKRFVFFNWFNVIIGIFFNKGN